MDATWASYVGNRGAHVGNLEYHEGLPPVVRSFSRSQSQQCISMIQENGSQPNVRG